MSISPLRRLAAVLAIRGTHLSAFAAQLGVSDQHLRLVLLGERVASERLSRALAAALGRLAPFVDGKCHSFDVRLAA